MNAGERARARAREGSKGASEGEDWRGGGGGVQKRESGVDLWLRGPLMDRLNEWLSLHQEQQGASPRHSSPLYSPLSPALLPGTHPISLFLSFFFFPPLSPSSPFLLLLLSYIFLPSHSLSVLIHLSHSHTSSSR